jgi:hypothetical protein
MAWLTGIKSDPWDIEWGHGSIGDVVLLRGIDEHVDYETALAQGRPRPSPRQCWLAPA